MSATTLPVSTVHPRLPVVARAASPATILHDAMQALASLKLTVALFAYGIFVVYVGTTAQQEADIWQVVRDYFHAWVIRLDVNLLFPKSFFFFMPHLSLPLIPLPGGLV